MKSWARQGLDLLLAYYPDANVVSFDAQLERRVLGPVLRIGGPPGPWWCVDLEMPLSAPFVSRVRHFAIFKATGAVYRCAGAPLAVADDPFLVPEGSPYTVTV